MNRRAKPVPYLKQTRLAAERFHIGGKAGKICVQCARTSDEQGVNRRSGARIAEELRAADLSEPALYLVPVMRAASRFLAHHKAKTRHRTSAVFG